MDAYPREAWTRLGQLLQQRRPQLDTRYRIRRVFAKEHGLTDKTVQEIENAYRDTFSPVMLATIEAAYRLRSGSIVRTLAGGDLEPEPEAPVAHVSQVRLTTPAAAEDEPRITQVDERRIQVDFTINLSATMADVYERLGGQNSLTPNERVMIANMEAMDIPPAEIGGAVLLLRRFRSRREQQNPVRREA